MQENGELVEKKIIVDSNPFGIEEVNYADAKFYTIKSPTPSRANEVKKERKKEDFESAALPSSSKIKSVQIKVNSSKKRERNFASKVSKTKFVLKCIVKDQQKSEQVAIMSVQDTSAQETMSTLTTSYTCPLRRINQSIPENLVITTTFEEDGSHDRRVVYQKKTLMFTSPSSVGPSKLKPKKKFFSKKENRNVIVCQENDMLKAVFF